MSIDEVVSFIRRFRDTHVQDYLERSREYANGSYGRYPGREDVIQGMRDLAFNLEEQLIPEIPEHFPSPKALLRTIGWFKTLADEKIVMIDQLLGSQYSDKEVEGVPEPVLALQKMARECSDFAEHVVGQECAKELLGQFLTRLKSEKFKILDSPNLREGDLLRAFGTHGAAVIYLDIDSFKRLNSTYTETVIDSSVLPEYQRLILDCVEGHGYAYAEGGDEVVIVLSNFSERMAMELAEAIRLKILSHIFSVAGSKERITVTLGVAHALQHNGSDLVGRANSAENEAKRNGKNRVICAPAK